MRSRIVLQRVKVPLAVLFGLILGVAGFALGHGGDTSMVHACVKKAAPNKGATRIVGANQACRDNERSVDWNKQGQPGAPAISEFAEFYALMPGDNSSTVAAGESIDFPENGPASGAISRLNDPTEGDSSFVLSNVGTYRVSFVVPVTEAGQLVLQLNGTELPYTVVGRSSGTAQIVGESLVETTVIDSTLSVASPESANNALTVTPLAGGTEPVSASLVIQRLE